MPQRRGNKPRSTVVRGQEGEARGPRLTRAGASTEGDVRRPEQRAIDRKEQHKTQRDEVPMGLAYGGSHLPYGEKAEDFDYPHGYEAEQYVNQFSNYKGGMEFRTTEVKHVRSHMDILDLEPKVPPRAKNTSRGRAQ